MQEDQLDSKKYVCLIFRSLNEIGENDHIRKKTANQRRLQVLTHNPLVQQVLGIGLLLHLRLF